MGEKMMDKIRYTWMYVCGCGNFVCFGNKADAPEKGRICIGCGADMESWVQHKAKEVSGLIKSGFRKRHSQQYFSTDTGELLATYTQPDNMVWDLLS